MTKAETKAIAVCVGCNAEGGDTVKKWITLAFLCLAFFFYMSDRQLFGLLVPLIQEETGMSKVQIGFIDTVLYWVVALMMPFSGFAGDRWPRTRVISAAILGWGALTLATGFMGGLVGFVLLRSIACTGVQTFYGPSAYALMADEHKTTRTTALSLHQGAMYTGMLTSGALVAVAARALRVEDRLHVLDESPRPPRLGRRARVRDG